MNRDQYREAARIIKADCKIGGLYINDEGETCVLGALGAAAGYDIKSLRNGRMRRLIGAVGMGTFVKAIQEKFGLDKADQTRLQKANDGNSDSARNHFVRMVLDAIFTAKQKAKQVA